MMNSARNTPGSSVLRCLTLLFALAWAAAPAGAVEPGEVSNLQFGADGETLSWDVEPLADHYNLYRGYLMDLASDFYGTTLEAEIVGTSHADPTNPTVGTALFYIVTAASADGEGTMGDSNGPTAAERANNYAWPGYEVAGRWEGLRAWPSVAIHNAVLHTGEVITWQGGNPTTAYRWNPETDQINSEVSTTNMFCSGHAFLPDGRLMVTGGNTTLFNGPNTTYKYDPIATAWSNGPVMRSGRYYPSVVAVPRGREQLVVFSGNNQDGGRNQDVEIYDKGPGGSGRENWLHVAGANRQLQLYPTMHLVASGLIFHSGPEVATQTFDPESGTWQFVANRNYGVRGGGTAVLLPPGHEQVMIVGGRAGGQALATNTAEIIDLSAATPAWTYTGSMLYRRMNANAVILPDGTVLITGGGQNDSVPSHPAELFDLATGTWTVVAMMKSFRLYHSTAVLLPDGRVMSSGSNFNPTAEFYSPGYLFRGARPVIDAAPESVRYGASFNVDTADAANIANVVLIRPSAVTHSVNMTQRYVSLDFTAGTNVLDVTAPSNANVAPPGYYMLFILDTDDVPSEAMFIQLK